MIFVHLFELFNLQLGLLDGGGFHDLEATGGPGLQPGLGGRLAEAAPLTGVLVAVANPLVFQHPSQFVVLLAQHLDPLLQPLVLRHRPAPGAALLPLPNQTLLVDGRVDRKAFLPLSQMKKFNPSSEILKMYKSV